MIIYCLLYKYITLYLASVSHNSQQGITNKGTAHTEVQEPEVGMEEHMEVRRLELLTLGKEVDQLLNQLRI